MAGWAIHKSESRHLAAELPHDACIKNEVNAGSLKVPQDNGSPAISSEYLSEIRLWNNPYYSRSGVSDENPDSESMFYTVKYRDGYPEVFDSPEAAKSWILKFIEWYHNKHLFSDIGFVTLIQRRKGEDKTIISKRIYTYLKARKKHPDRRSGSVRNRKAVEILLNPEKAKKSRQEIVA